VLNTNSDSISGVSWREPILEIVKCLKNISYISAFNKASIKRQSINDLQQHLMTYIYFILDDYIFNCKDKRDDRKTTYKRQEDIKPMSYGMYS
jgi:hypothetical protein